MTRCTHGGPLYYRMWVDSEEVPPLVIPGHLPPSRMPWDRIESWLRQVYRGRVPESDLEVIREMGPISTYRSRVNACLLRCSCLCEYVYDSLYSQGLHRVWLVDGEEDGLCSCRALVAPISDLLDPVLEVSRDSDTFRVLVQDYLGGRWLGPEHGVLDVCKEQPWLEATLREILEGKDRVK